MTVDPALPPPAPGEDEEDAAARYAELVRRRVKAAVKRFRRLADAHGGGSVALANTGSRGVRLVFVAADGVFGDAMVPNVVAAEQVCEIGEWEITGWDAATVNRMSPTPADRRRMAGTGR